MIQLRLVTVDQKPFSSMRKTFVQKLIYLGISDLLVWFPAILFTNQTIQMHFSTYNTLYMVPIALHETDCMSLYGKK